MPDNAVAGLDVAEIAASSLALPRRAEQMLAVLRRLVPFDGAWLALADPHHPRYTTAAAADLADSTLTFFTSLQQARDIEATGTDRARPPLSPSDLRFPVQELPGWAECLIPAGYREGLAVALFGPGGQHVGFLATLSGDGAPPAPETRRALARLAPVLARGVDPVRSLATIARLVRKARAGVIVSADGSAEPLPGMDGHPVLATGAPAVAAACVQLAAGRVHRSFLWPVGGRHAPGGHLRITALAPPSDLPVHLAGVVLVSQAGDLNGLTPRELEVLGLLVDGRSNREIARTLVVAQRTVAAHIEHILVKLATPTRTLAAVRAERAGLYVPCVPGRAVPSVPGLARGEAQ
jgi:DNA-binding CsgD family transcriptional regulator